MTLLIFFGIMVITTAFSIGHAIGKATGKQYMREIILFRIGRNKKPIVPPELNQREFEEQYNEP